MNTQSESSRAANGFPPIGFGKSLLSPLVIMLMVLGCASLETGRSASTELQPEGPDTLRSGNNLLTNHMARNEDGTINVVIEIPSGTSERWEVSEDGFALMRESPGPKTQIINDLLPYPGNYGFIPRTLLDPEKGGDGGALDVMILGPAVARGTVVRARPIGVIRLVDRMEQDDKILAVAQGPALKEIHDMASLQAGYPGVIEILDLWWTHAYGQGTDVNLLGTGSRAQANSVIDFAMQSWLEMRRKARQAEEQNVED